jgi:murein DD-endopeptidase MepM/ murein hydrolase activator NlpD
MGKNRKLVFWLSVVTAAAACVGASYYMRHSAEKRFTTEVAAAHNEAEWIEEHVVHFARHSVPSGRPFATFLEGLGIDSNEATRVVASAQPVFNFRQVRAGNRLEIGRSVHGELREVRYWIDTDRILSIESNGDDFQSKIETLPSETQTIGLTGEIDDSLFQAVVDTGEKPELAMRLAEIFGWDLDFYTDPRPGDTFRFVVEKRMLANGNLVGYGRILAAEYINSRHAYRAVLFHDPSGHPAYYTPEGKSMKKVFLHSPLKFAAPITSHFSLHRFHPILKRYRPHLGIDYGAPTGTPVQTIGDGRVIFAGRKGGDGKLVKVKHTNGYVTYYMHLSRILVRRGQRVEQGQRIGLVGMTGLATGPHLDFRIQTHGRFLNFERLPLPPANPVAKRDWKEFVAARDRDLAQMPPLPSDRAILAKNTPQGSQLAAR